MVKIEPYDSAHYTGGVAIDDNLPEVIAAIAVVRRHLDDAWISDGCRHPDTQVWGCVSCQAVALDRDLRLLEESLKDDLDAPSPSPKPSPHSHKQQ